MSAGLALGNVSVELVNVTLQDSGEYTCYVSSDQNHDSASVTLTVIGECDGKCKNHLKGSKPGLWSLHTVTLQLDTLGIIY